MRKLLSKILIALTYGFLAINFAASLWATAYLYQQGQGWVVLLWFFFVVPSFILPFLTPLWLLYLLSWVGFLIFSVWGFALDAEGTNESSQPRRQGNSSEMDLAGQAQWHDFAKNSGFPNYGSVKIDSSGIWITENSYEDNGPAPDRWFIGWGYAQGTYPKIEEQRINLFLPGFGLYLYPNSAAELNNWASVIIRYQKLGGQNVRRRF